MFYNETKKGESFGIISFKEVKSKLRLKNSDVLFNKFDINKSDKLIKKNLKEDKIDFTLLTDKIITMVKGTITTYSFMIETPTVSSSTFENFVIIQTPQTISYRIYRFEETTDKSDFPFSITTQVLSLDDISTNNFSNFLNRYAIIDGCLYDVYTDPTGLEWRHLIGCFEGGGGSSGYSGENTNTYSDEEDLYNNDYDNDEGPHDSMNNTESSGGGDNENNQSNEDVPNIGVVQPPYEYTISTCLGIENVTADMASWINSSSSTKKRDIVHFIQDNNCSTEAQNFVLQAIEALMVEEGDFSEIPIIDTPEVPINDISEFLDCFELNQLAQLTIFVDQPISNSNIVVNTHSVGHAFIGITQGSNISIFGFYPNNNSTTPWNTEAPPIFGDDSSHVFDVSLTINITPTQLNNIINHTLNFTNNYDLNENNCTDFAIQIGNLGGLNIDECNSNWIIGGGSNPAKLGQTIRNMDLPNGSSRDTDGGDAPQNNKDC